jgi:hypothetical protein
LLNGEALIFPQTKLKEDVPENIPEWHKMHEESYIDGNYIIKFDDNIVFLTEKLKQRARE